MGLVLLFDCILAHFSTLASLGNGKRALVYEYIYLNYCSMVYAVLVALDLSA